MPPASAITSVIRRWRPRSMPLTTDRMSADAGTWAATRSTVSRRCADGVANTTRPVASARAEGSWLARIPAGRSMPGSRASLRRVSAMRAAVSGEWHRSVTGSRWATIAASVVPHAPAPMTATRAGASPNPERDPSAARHQPFLARGARAPRKLRPDLVTEDESDRGPVEAVGIAQPVLEVAPVREVDRRRVRREEHERRRRDGRLGRVDGSSSGVRGPRPAASARWRPRRDG